MSQSYPKADTAPTHYKIANMKKFISRNPTRRRIPLLQQIMTKFILPFVVAILPEGGYRSYSPTTVHGDTIITVAILPEGGYRSYYIHHAI